MKPFIILTAILIMSISLNSHAQKLPKTWSPTTKLEAHYGGGMMYYSYDILITDTLSYMKIVSNKGAENYTRKFTPKELDALLAFLEVHRFHQIKSEDTGLTRDKASESILLSWEGNLIGASESASRRITEKYREDFNTIQAYIEGLFQQDK